MLTMILKAESWNFIKVFFAHILLHLKGQTKHLHYIATMSRVCSDRLISFIQYCYHE